MAMIDTGSSICCAIFLFYTFIVMAYNIFNKIIIIPTTGSFFVRGRGTETESEVIILWRALLWPHKNFALNLSSRKNNEDIPGKSLGLTAGFFLLFGLLAEAKVFTELYLHCLFWCYQCFCFV